MINIISEGKLFEQDFKKSTPVNCWLYRFKDNASSFGGGDKTRFTTSNICDFLCMSDKYLFLLELKSHKGASIPLSCIRKNQIDEMSCIDHNKIKAYFILNFREKEQTYGIEAKKLKNYMDTTKKKSIPLSWCIENGIGIESNKKKVRYSYELENFFEVAI